jgi:hypothetical protein
MDAAYGQLWVIGVKGQLRRLSVIGQQCFSLLPKTNA